MSGHIDDKHVFSDDQAITAAAASTNSLDFGEVAPNRGTGRKIMAEVIVTETFVIVGAETLTIALQHKDEGGAFADLATTGAIAKESFVKGAKFYIDLPEGAHKRHLQLYYTPGTGPFTAGKVFAHLMAG